MRESYSKAKKAWILILLIMTHEMIDAGDGGEKQRIGKMYNKPYSLTKAITKTQFQKVGKMSAQAATAHVLFTFPVNRSKEAQERIYSLCRLINKISKEHNDTLSKWKFGREKMGYLAEDCRLAVLEVYEIKKDMQVLFSEQHVQAEGTRGPRVKRFLGTLAAIALGALGLYTANQLWQMKRSFEHNSDRTKIYAILKDDFEKIEENKSKVAAMKSTLYQLIKKAGEIQKEVDIIAQIDVMRRHLMEELRQLRELNASLMNLMNGVITTSVISTSLMLKAKRELVTKAEKEDYVIPFQHLMEYYQLPKNVLIQDEELTLFIHVPLVSEKGLLNLYMMVPTVLTINENINGLIHEKSLIGITKDNGAYRVTTREELDQCVLMRMQYYYCPTTLLYRNFNAYCISAVYKGHWERANDICELKILPDTSWADQISEEEFILYHHKEEAIQIECDDGNEKFERIMGTYYFETNQRSCKVTSDYYEFQTMPRAEVQIERIDRPIKWKNETLLKMIEPTFVEKMLKTLNSVEPTKVGEFYKKYEISQQMGSYTEKVAAGIPGYIALAIILLLGCAVVYILRKRSQRKGNSGKQPARNIQRRQNKLEY